ncbi:tripartite tricarboxylate transporter substrate binding protein [Parashewanella tropica]|uniref:tripartite tricarboxylate transporter substrate binding protein n=1 Tax=Parashewanella tropica TaxID=2547970 RepID=UPI00105A67CD|nr:tripartite tricarboxylate transporter substrate binding protein [Parashewanella tropica]
MKANTLFIFKLTLLILFSAMFNTAYGSTQKFPVKPIKLIVPYKAGGGVDSYARAIAAAPFFQKTQPFAVINQAGYGGIKGTMTLRKAKPDGHTLLLVSASSLLLSSLHRKPDLDPFSSFQVIAQVGELNTALVVPADSPYQNTSKLVRAIQDKHSKMRWGHSGRNSFHHFSGMGFLNANHLKVRDVPFRGGGPARAALISHQVDFGFIGVQQLKGYESLLKGLAVNAHTRDEAMSNIPTFTELGIKNFSLSSPVVLLAPKNTPKIIVNQLQQMLKQLAKVNTLKEKLANQGLNIKYADSQQTQFQLTELFNRITNQLNTSLSP